MKKRRLYRTAAGWAAGLCLLLTACSIPHQQEVDACNDKAYAFHYRSLDSVDLYARRAYRLAKRYDAGRAEALNNLAFADLMKMRFTEAFAKLDSVLQITDNQVELLVADIQLMRLCQRESLNKEFYDYYEKAQKRLHRIEEDESLLSARQRRRMVYARTEFAIVTSTYYYYVGLEQPSVKAIRQINPDGEIQTDMAQLLDYYYNIGAGGIFTTGTQEAVSQREFDYLMRCYMLARQHGYPYWEANSLQALSEHLVNDRSRRTLMRDNLPSFQFLNLDNMPDSLLAGNLVQRSLNIFRKYGDVYQTAGSYRTLASCYWQIKDYRSAIICLQKALNDNPAIRQAPDLVASIREQLSVTYSAINNKQQSDYNRNIYLDLQDETRQDRYLASRAEQLDRTSQQLNLIIAAVGLSILIVLALLVLSHYLRRRSDRRSSLDDLLLPLEQWRRQNGQHRAAMTEKYGEIAEQLDLCRLHLVDNRRKNLEQRAKVSLVNSVIPLIDRMLHEIGRLKKGGESETLKAERYTYICELTDKINELNTVLTQWIQLRQGRLSLHIESFPVQQVFDIVKKGRMGFQMKGIDLRVEDTGAVVKADRVLTLFMVNTLADNARKFTGRGGRVTIRAAEEEGYVEISVADTGCGLSETQQAHIFDYKPIRDQSDCTSHGFGLMNCNGIINKYRKISQIFSVCRIGVESREGRGSRFFFRLPKGISRMAVLLLSAVCGLTAASARPVRAIDKAAALARHDYGTLAGIYADSAYFSNINGSYSQTLAYADTCRYYINQLYRRLRPKGKDLMLRTGSLPNVPAEIRWIQEGIPMDYAVILDIRNESAVAALALHEWDLYRYNNSVYTHLFKERYADRSLGEYCRMMMKSETNKNVAVALLILFLLSIFPVYYVMYYRRRLSYQFCLERVKSINTILLSDMDVQEKLREVERAASDRFPPRLLAIVTQIRDALLASVEEDQKSQADIEMLEDEVRCTEYENERLHISNSILDNCLSTLKHETMYYPSRIRQLVDQPGNQLDSIDELAVYYKELYLILSQQAMRQVEGVKLIARPLDLAALVSAAKLTAPVPAVPPVSGDPVLIAYLFDILYQSNHSRPLTVSAGEGQPGYVTLHVLMSALHLSDEACRQLFQPSADHLMSFICRQIVRDNGEATNRRGCGISATATPDGTSVKVVLSQSSQETKTKDTYGEF